MNSAIGRGVRNGSAALLQTEIQEGRAHARSTSQSQLIAHPMEIYKVSMEEARWRAVFPGNFAPVLKTLGNVSRLRARSAHFVGHLPPGSGAYERIIPWKNPSRNSITSPMSRSTQPPASSISKP